MLKKKSHKRTPQEKKTIKATNAQRKPGWYPEISQAQMQHKQNKGCALGEKMAWPIQTKVRLKSALFEGEKNLYPSKKARLKHFFLCVFFQKKKLVKNTYFQKNPTTCFKTPANLHPNQTKVNFTKKISQSAMEMAAIGWYQRCKLRFQSHLQLWPLDSLERFVLRA